MFNTFLQHKQLQQEVASLKQELLQSQQDNQRLQAQNDELREELSEYQAQFNDDTDNQLLQCALHGMSQVFGIRESVAQSFNDIEQQSQSISTC